MFGMRLSACARLCVVVYLICGSEARAQVAAPEVIALSDQQPPGTPDGSEFGLVDGVVLSAVGDVAFHASGAGQPGVAGVYAWRAGQLSRVVGAGDMVEVSPGELATVSPGPIPMSMSSTGAVLVFAILQSPSIFSESLLLCDGGTVTPLLIEGQAIPGLGGRVTGRLFERATMLWTPQPMLTEDGVAAWNSGLTPQMINDETIVRAVWRLSPSARDVVATCGSGAGATHYGCSWVPGDINSSLAIAYSATEPAGGQQAWLGDGDGLRRLLPVGQSAPDWPGAVISSSGNALVNEAGEVFVVGSALQAGGIWLGAPQDLRLALRVGQVVGGTSVSAIVNQLGIAQSNRLAYSLGDDGVSYCLATVGGVPSIVRSRAGHPAETMTLHQEFAGAPGGTRFVPYSWARSQDFGRIAFGAACANGPWINRSVILTWDVDFSPVVVAVNNQAVEVAPGDVRTTTWSLDVSALSFRTNYIANDAGHVTLRGTFAGGGSGVFRVTIPRAACGDIDFNNDGLYPDTQDVQDFLAVFGGGACPSLRCDTIDFNRDDVSPDTADIDGLLAVFAGAGCP